ncbi:MAG TPA: cytochrome c peroxidase [Isosphaeraceae bacterium]|nr:cytochrome c peroxidase [Isosphaeraceae bacterium]
MRTRLMTKRPPFRLFVLFWLTALQFHSAPREGIAGDTPVDTDPLANRMRQPVALAIAEDGKSLFVANRRSGSLSVIDTTRRKVVAEHDFGRGLADVAILAGGRHLLAVDQEANELLLIDGRDRSIRVVDRIKVSPDPIRLVVLADGPSCVLASLWSRRLTFVSLERRDPVDIHPVLAITARLDLPFCPREMAVVADGSRLIVADAFGGRLAVVDFKQRTIESVRTLPAHNIRGLAVAPDGKTLVVAHQVQSRLAQSSFDDVHWGLLIRNHLRILQIDTLLRPGPDAALLDSGRLFDLGDVGYAAGDPGDLAFDARGNLIVALAGVDEVAITASPDQGPRRIVVGRQPTAVIPSPDGSLVYVADSLDDTISVVDIASGLRPATIALGPRPDLTSRDRGERLFSSAKLSHDGWMSCHSCHSDGHTNNLLSDTLGDGSYGAPKRVPSLLGVAATGPWTWTGSVARLDDQIKKSIVTTMHGPKPSDEQVSDLAAYLTSLAPPSPRQVDIDPLDASAVSRGREVFATRKCAICHVAPEYTSPERFDVGLTDEVGNREFNPPSLRSVSRRDALLHDGRTHSLEEVFRKERHPRGLALSPQEIADLVAFLKTL